MLDQNTDRMWYVIGAVIVGAAIIFLANGTLPSLFASVTDSFSESSDSALSVVDTIDPHESLHMVRIPIDELINHRSTLTDYDVDTGVLSMTLNARVESDVYWIYDRGLQVSQGYVLVPYNHRMTLSYEVFVPDDGIDYSTRVEINNALVDTSLERWSHNDFDDTSMRRITVNGVQQMDVDVPLVSGQWNTVTYSYVNSSHHNTTQSDIYDTSRFGMRNHTFQPVPIQIRNVSWAVTDY